MPHVVIVGGGLTGLAVAYRLKQASPGTSVTVLESRDRPGGNVGTEDHNGFRVETGPNGFLDRTPSVPRLLGGKFVYMSTMLTCLPEPWNSWTSLATSAL